MKKILIGTAVGLFVSMLLFIWSWKGMEKTYLIPKQTANQEFCNQLEICQKCNRKYECLKNECDKNSAIKGNCRNIEKTWEAFPLELTPENFVSSLCGVNDDFYNRNCLKEQGRNSKLELELALARIPYNIGISHILLLFGIYNLSLFGIIILFIPPLLGFFIGWIIYLFQKRKVDNK